jgi:hypothetical protein
LAWHQDSIAKPECTKNLLSRVGWIDKVIFAVSIDVQLIVNTSTTANIYIDAWGQT